MDPLRRARAKSDHLKQDFRKCYRRVHFWVKLQSLPSLENPRSCQGRVLGQLKCSVVYFAVQEFALYIIFVRIRSGTGWVR
jgi:hypothetical protein